MSPIAPAVPLLLKRTGGIGGGGNALGRVFDVSAGPETPGGATSPRHPGRAVPYERPDVKIATQTACRLNLNSEWRAGMASLSPSRRRFRRVRLAERPTGQSEDKTQSSQRGLMARHTARPWATAFTWKSKRSGGETTTERFRSMAAVLPVGTNPKRIATRAV